MSGDEEFADYSDELLGDDFEDDADGYEMFEEPVEKKESNYICLKPADIVQEQNDTITKVAELFSIPAPTARQLLNHMKWNVDALTERFYGGEEDELWKESGIPNPHKKKKQNKIDPKRDYECTICMEEYPGKKMKQIICGHMFCKDCWKGYLEVTINEGQVTVIACPGRDCNVQLDEATITKMLGERKKGKELLDKYHMLIANAYVNDNKNVRWCPGRNCGNAIRVQLLKENEVQCDCGTKFCFGCGSLPHNPATCKMVSEWENKSSKDEANAKWIAAYTKECPKCNFIIHKDGGCQYMRCSNCSHAFCWMCMGAFDHKDHACNKLVSEAGIDPNSARAQLNKYTHFLMRYNMHQQSIQLEDKLMAAAEKLMQELTDKGMSWIDVQFIKQATEALMECRPMLKFTYVYGYYLPETTNRDIFEYLQADLEAGVERLSQLLEAKGDKDRVTIINATEYVRQRQKNLLQGLMENDIQGKSAAPEKVYVNTEAEQYDGWVYKAGN